MVGFIWYKMINPTKVFVIENFIFRMKKEDEVEKMNISANLTQKKLQEILINSYKKGQEKENLRVAELIEDIKRQVILAVKE
jgi:hypothetical protein